MDFSSWLINEETKSVTGLDKLIEQIKSRYPLSPELTREIKKFVIECNIKHIETQPMTFALGAALLDRVIINQAVLQYPLAKLLYVIFHECAHQYQYKKHGHTKMFKYFNNQLSEQEAVKFLRWKETIADNYAISKLKSIKKLVPDSEFKTQSLYPMYKGISDQSLLSWIRTAKSKLKEKNEINPEEISSVIYNFILPNNTNPYSSNKKQDDDEENWFNSHDENEE